jgi:gliding motility-associated-like protein
VNEGTTLASTASVATGNIVTWNWNLGNAASPVYTNDDPFTVNYPNHNTYNISLVTMTDMGCVSPATSQTLDVHPLPVVSFDLPSGICMPQGNATFTNNTSVAGNSALAYVWNFGDLGSSTEINPSHTYAATGTYDVTLTATSAFGCIAAQTLVLDDFYDRPVASFIADPAELCQGTANTFTSNSSDPNGADITGYNWVFGDQSAPSTVAGPTHTYTQPGDYSISLVVTNEIGCQSLPFSQPVTVYMQPQIDAGNSFVVAQGSIIQFTATSNSPAFTFNWSPATGLSDASSLTPTLTANADEMYTLTATGDFGCAATDFITVKILKPVKVPNVFTPNGDNIHDKWMIPNLADYPTATVEVFNRYGQQVFFSKGYNTPWDGTLKGKGLPAAAYYYVIRLGSGFPPISGSVTILK